MHNVLLYDRLLTCREDRACPTSSPTRTRCSNCRRKARPVPARPQWLLAIPDAIRQLEDLDRELLTRRDIEQLFGVSRARAAQLMHTFGARSDRVCADAPAHQAAAAAADVPRVPTRSVLKYTLRATPRELGGVDLDLAVEDDVLPLDRADMPQQVGVEREVRRGGQP